MPRYTSRTGRNIVLRFKDTIINIPAYGYYETSAEDLDISFPDKIRKIQPDEILKEQEVEPLHIREINQQKINSLIIEKEKLTNTNIYPPIPILISPHKLTIMPATISISPITITQFIQNIKSPKLRNIILNLIPEVTLTPIKEITIEKKIIEKISKNINIDMGANEDPDVVAFLDMIGQIISQK